jgi:4-hydroxy-tetrahydrodipicolinate reductase
MRESPGSTCLIDFTRPEGTLQHLEACRRHGVGMVIGTTGFAASGKAAIAARRRTSRSSSRQT